MHGRSVVIKTAAGPDMGLGHLRRCLALASALRKAGARTACWTERETAEQIVQDAGYEVRRTMADDLPAPGTSDAVIFDGYHYDEALLAKARDHAAVVLAIQDHGPVPVPAHVVLNSGVDMSQSGRTTEDCEFLLGPRYALLDPVFSQPPHQDYPAFIRRVLLTVGGGDPHRLMPRLMAWTRDQLPQASLEAVIGPFFAETAELTEMAERCRVKLWRNPREIHALMLNLDLAISAAGQTLFQLAACAVPTIALGLFKNQAQHAQTLVKHGIVAWAGWYEDAGFEARLGVAIAALADVLPRRQLGECARGQIDGRGAERVVEAMSRRLQRASIHA